MSPRLLALLALSALAFAAVPASAQKPPYTLTVNEHTNTQTLRNKRTGRIVWVRHFPDARNVTWSKDRRAVMFETEVAESETPQHGYDIKLALWKAGSSVQNFFPRPFIRADYVEDMFWSPHKKYLLFRTGNSGEGDVGHGTLWCLKVATHHMVLVSQTVRRVRWAGPRCVEYLPVYHAPGHYLDPDTDRVERYEIVPYESSKPRSWRLPTGF